MPIKTSSLTAKIKANLRAQKLFGTAIGDISKGVASGFKKFLPQIQVSTTHVGIIGAGSGTGKMTLQASQGTNLISQQMKSKGLTGPNQRDLAKGVAKGLTQEIQQNGLVQVTIVGTSTGTGQGSVSTAPPSPLRTLIETNLRAQGMNGSAIPDVSSGLSKGISQFLKTGNITTQDTGSPAPPGNTSTGKGTGKLL